MMILLLIWTTPSLAEGPRFQLRAGVEQIIQETPLVAPSLLQMCGEIRVYGPVSFAACGNGSGFLHQRETLDMAHFRAQIHSPALVRGMWTTKGHLGAGIAEIQTGRDAPGFRFGAAIAGQNEAAGPEAAAGLRVQSAEKIPVVFDLTGGVAMIPGALEVLGSDTAAVPFMGFSVGIFR